jgi:DNA-binding LacI/PurR family transcriptional regulator
MKKENPVYAELVDYLKNGIDSGKFKKGDRIPGENALAEKFKISRVSVRKGIKELIDMELLNSIQGKGAFVTRPSEIRKAKELNIALVNKSIMPGGDMYLDVQEALCIRLNSLGCRIELLPSPLSSDTFFKNISSDRFDLIIWLFPNEEYFSAIDELSDKLECPFLIFDRKIPGRPDIPSAMPDENYAMEQAVKLILNYNHKDILFLYRGKRQYNLRRRDVFINAMRKNNIQVPDSNVIDIVDIADFENHLQAAAELIASRKPDAVFFGQGAITREILFYLYGMGIKTPQDLSVITFDHVKTPYGSKITHIYTDFEELAKRSADYIVKTLREPDKKILTPVVSSDLILGDSCAPH